MLRPLLLVSIACGIGLACGGGQPATSPSGTTASDSPVVSAPVPAASSETPPEVASVAPAASSAAPEPEKAWKDKSRDEKLQIMKTVVMPKMKPLFQEFDAKEFKDFTCVTCHGPGAKEGKFDMPNAKLPKLNAKDGFKKETKEHPKAMKFMMEKVVPEMASALGVQPFDPKTMTGFGCGGCHLVDH